MYTLYFSTDMMNRICIFVWFTENFLLLILGQKWTCVDQWMVLNHQEPKLVWSHYVDGGNNLLKDWRWRYWDMFLTCIENSTLTPLPTLHYCCVTSSNSSWICVFLFIIQVCSKNLQLLLLLDMHVSVW